MLEKPMTSAARLARRLQGMATRVALKAARVADALNARVADRVRARAIREALRAAKKPGIHFVRDVRHGRMCFSFYRSVDRAGNVREFWTLSKDTGRGRVRLATGSTRDFREIRAAISRTVGLERDRTPRPLAAERQAPRREAARDRGRTPPRPRPRPRRHQEGPRPEQEKLWWTLVYVEGSHPDGKARVRVVRSVNDATQALGMAKQNPKLALYHNPMLRPLQQGTVLAVEPRHLMQAAVTQQHARPPSQPAVAPRQELNGHAKEHRQRIDRDQSLGR